MPISKLKLIPLLGAVTLTQACSVIGIQGEEQPQFTLLKAEGNKEIRLYKEHVAAQTQVSGEFKDAQGEAFGRLAGYIFGDNANDQSISMTAPVFQTPTTDNITDSMDENIAASDQWTMSFFMPSEYELEQLPVANDDRVVIKAMPERLVAAIRFSGLWKEETNKRKAEELVSWVSDVTGYEVVSEAEFAGYNPPWTLPWFRTNEMIVELRKSDES